MKKLILTTINTSFQLTLLFLIIIIPSFFCESESDCISTIPETVNECNSISIISEYCCYIEIKDKSKNPIKITKTCEPFQTQLIQEKKDEDIFSKIFLKKAEWSDDFSIEVICNQGKETNYTNTFFNKHECDFAHTYIDQEFIEDKCKKIPINIKNNETEGGKCCFVEVEDKNDSQNNQKKCLSLSENQYTNTSELFSYLINKFSSNKIIIDCDDGKKIAVDNPTQENNDRDSDTSDGSYIYLSILYLLMFFLYF